MVLKTFLPTPEGNYEVTLVGTKKLPPIKVANEYASAFYSQVLNRPILIESTYESKICVYRTSDGEIIEDKNNLAHIVEVSDAI